MDSNIFFEIHNNLIREAPGSNLSTEKAFRLMDHLPPKPNILDVGCGPGMQTIVLAKLSDGIVTGLDNHQPFLTALSEKVQTDQLGDHVKIVNASMFDMDFAPTSFDLIWSEGAIYIIGLEQGLQNWHRFLKPKGYIAVTEISWLKENPPKEVFDFWHQAYPTMNSISKNIEIIKQCGYRVISHFVLPESDWWDYYHPIESRIESLSCKYAGNNEAMKTLHEEKQEIEMYRKYSQWYGYVFYIMQKNG